MINSESLAKVEQIWNREQETIVGSAKYKQIVLLRNKLNFLIASTETGEERNQLTDINILFENIIG